jgi:peptidoglycan hydrolase-like protein with peptidoglycan-binding domain
MPVSPLSRPAVPAPATLGPLLLGVRGPAVAALQRVLAQRGFLPGAADGIFGEKTRAAVEAFQRHAGLEADGVVGPLTRAALADRTAPAPSSRQLSPVGARTGRKDVFLAPARAEVKRLQAVSSVMASAVADGAVTSAESQALSAVLARARAPAARLVAGQSAPVLAALDAVARALESGKLVVRAGALEDGLSGARSTVLSEAQAAASRNPFARGGWKRAFAGVATKELRVHGLRASVVAVDLADPRVSLETNRASARGRSVSSFAGAHRAEVAINADFFSWGSFKPSGFAMTAGKAWAGTSDKNFEGFLAFTGRNAEVVKPYGKNPAWSRNAVSGRPSVLKDGEAILSDPTKNDRSARTGLGLSKDGRVLYLVAVEGKSGVRGLRATELGAVLKSLGAYDGLALDSGGSAQLFVKGRGMVQRSTDASGSRAVANVLMVQSRA